LLKVTENMFFKELFANKILMASLLSWIVAQALKVVFYYIKHRKFDISKFFSSGSMPSSHSAFVTALVVSVGIIDGVGTTAFAISVVSATVVMYDASGVRLAAGKQAKLLNQIVVDFYKERSVKTEKLKELLGHTPLEVFVGSFLGAVIACLMCIH